MDLIAIVAAVAAAVIGLLGLRALSGSANERRRIIAAAAGYDRPEDQPLTDRLNRWFVQTRVGQWVEREVTIAGIAQRPIVVAAGAAAGGLLTAYALWVSLAPVFGIAGLAAGVVGLRAYIDRAKQRRLEAFIVQMPEIARVLANATNAGLAISTAIAIAGDELDEPAGTELRKAGDAMRFGSDLETALNEMSDRLPSREVSVLLSTLLVSARSGGSLVTSLRNIADTLEARKETRREIKTTLAQSVATGYLIVALGVGMLFLLNLIQPGSVEAMTGHIVGQATLVIATLLFVGGVLIIRRMTRMEI